MERERAERARAERAEALVIELLSRERALETSEAKTPGETRPELRAPGLLDVRARERSASTEPHTEEHAPAELDEQRALEVHAAEERADEEPRSDEEHAAEERADEERVPEELNRQHADDAKTQRDLEPTGPVPAPPRVDPPGMISIRSAHGWLTIPKTWIRSHARPEDQAKLARLLAASSQAPRHSGRG